MKVLFLLSLATAKRVSELQAISMWVTFQGDDLSLSYLPEFGAKTESECNPLPHSFLVRSLVNFVGDLPVSSAGSSCISSIDCFFSCASSVIICVSSLS